MLEIIDFLTSCHNVHMQSSFWFCIEELAAQQAGETSEQEEGEENGEEGEAEYEEGEHADTEETLTGQWPLCDQLLITLFSAFLG